MQNWILGGILLILAGCAVFYLYKAKKHDGSCGGCPYAGTCSQKSCTKKED